MAYTVYYDTPGTILTYSQMQSALAALASANSWTYQTFGQSENEVDIDGVIINPTGYQKTTYIQGCIHGNEKRAARAILDLLNYFDETPSAVSSTMRYIVIPVVNPDGYNANTRKNVNNNVDDNLEPWPRTVDLNRNFPNGFTVLATDHLNYGGPSAVSEAETAVIIDVLDTYSPNFVIDTHTPENRWLAAGGYCAHRKASVDAAWTANGFTPQTFSVDSTLRGVFGHYAWINAHAELYLFELNTSEVSPTAHEEINRYICACMALFGSFENAAHKSNIFIADPTCVAHWRFNQNFALGGDDQYSCTLTNYNGTQDTTDFIEGDASASLTGAYAYLGALDANLPDSFPFKSGGSNTALGFTGWFSLDSLPASTKAAVIFSKFVSLSAQQCSLMVAVANTGGVYTLRLYNGYNNGIDFETLEMLTFAPTAGVPYFIGFGYDAPTRAWMVELYDEDGRIGGATGTSVHSAPITASRFALGASFYNSNNLLPSTKFYGNLDDVAVFNVVPSTAKIADIWAREYTATSSGATGTLAATLADSTSSSAGAVPIAGASAQTLANSTTSSAGAVAITGASAPTLASATLSSAGAVVSGITGSFAQTLADSTLSGTGTVAIAAALAQALADAAVSSSGSVLASGVLGAILADSTVAATGTVAVSGSLASTLADATVNASSSASAIGALSATLSDASLGASGAVAVAGSASAALAESTASSAGRVTVSGSMSATLADATLSAYFGDSAPAQAAMTLASSTLAASGEVAIIGALSAALQDAFASGAGTVDIDAECAVTLADCAGVIAGRVAIVGGGGATLADSTLAARAGANLVPDAHPSRIVRVARENRIVRVARENRIVRA